MKPVALIGVHTAWGDRKPPTAGVCARPNASSGFPGCGKRRSGGFTPPYAYCNDWVIAIPQSRDRRYLTNQGFFRSLFRARSGVSPRSEWPGRQPDYRRVGGQHGGYTWKEFCSWIRHWV